MTFLDVCRVIQTAITVVPQCLNMHHDHTEKLKTLVCYGEKVWLDQAEGSDCRRLEVQSDVTRRIRSWLAISMLESVDVTLSFSCEFFNAGMHYIKQADAES